MRAMGSGGGRVRVFDVLAACLVLAAMLVAAQAAPAQDCPAPSKAMTIVAENNRWRQDCLAAPAGTPFTVTLQNEDRFAHNLSIYREEGGEAFFTGEYVKGHQSHRYEVGAIEAGTWYFRCDIHPTTMEGTFQAAAQGGAAVSPSPTETEGQGDATRSPVPSASEEEKRAPIGATIRLERVATGITAPVFFTAPDDGTGRLFIVDQVGLVRVVENGELRTEPFLDVREKIVELDPEYDERGLLSIAFHPQYRENRRFYAYYSAPLRRGAPSGWNHTARLVEFRATEQDANRADPASERIIMEIDQPQGNHNGGHIAFGPDGMLYIPLGDGGNANDVGLGHAPAGNGQTLSTVLGKVLRIDVNTSGSDRYQVPEDNPFVDRDGARPEIFAYGFRNPYHLSFDAAGDQQLFVADAGQDRFEEVSIVTSGGNYGWRIKEGTHCFDPERPSQPPESCPSQAPNGDRLIDPVIEYSHEDIASSVVIGGYIYRGSRAPALRGRYIFGDYSRDRTQPDGILFAARPSNDGLWDLQELLVDAGSGGETTATATATASPATASPGTDGTHSTEGKLGRFLLGFGEDEAHELYIGVIELGGPTGATGAVYRVVGSTRTGDDDAGDTGGGIPTWVLIVAALVVLAGAAGFVISRR